VSLSSDIKHIIEFKLPPKEAIEYLKQKGYKLTFNYQELQKEAHHHAFTVAKIQRLDLLFDIKEALHKALKSGQSFEQFKKEIKPTLIKKGWWGKVEAIDKKTGEIKNITVNSHRLHTIFFTNTRVAYQVKKAKKYYEDKNITYLKYIAILDNNVRPSHKAMHGIILPKEHSFWQTNFPPNGYNCRCRVRAISKLSANRQKDKIKQSLELAKNNPIIADKEFAHDITKGRYFDRYTLNDSYTNASSNYKDFYLPSAKEIKEQNIPPAPPRLPKAKDKKEALEILTKEVLQDKKSITIKTPITDVLIDESLLRHSIEDNKDSREVYAKYILPTLTKPVEVWAHKSKSKTDSYYKKRYRFIKLFKDKKDNLLAIVELRRDGSLFWTFFKINNLNQVDKKREGILMYADKENFE